MSRRTWSSLFALAVLTGSSALSGCPATVGDVCTADDLTRARRVAYSSDGLPAYEGQALVITSCGGASYCHTQTPAGPTVPRFGAPADLDFDPLLVEGAADETAAQARLLAAIGSIHRHRDAVYASVVSGFMPPAGRPPVPDLREAAAAYRTYAGAADTTGTPLPGIQTPEGEAILRNWLACGSPVVERTAEPATVLPCTQNSDCEVTRACDLDLGECRPVGDVVPRRATALTPTWSSIHANVIRPSCATTGCHIGASSFNGLDLSSRDAAYEALITRDATAGCGMRSYVSAGDPSASVLIDKLAEVPSCGGRMPPSGLSAETVAVITQWVMDGARND
jgi:hypothetical protein